MIWLLINNKVYYLFAPPLLLLVGFWLKLPAEFPPEFDVGEGLVDDDATAATAATAAAGFVVAAQKSCPAAAADAAAERPLRRDSVWL